MDRRQWAADRDHCIGGLASFFGFKADRLGYRLVFKHLDIEVAVFSGYGTCMGKLGMA
nr:hypothetical protein Q903MT_gene4859 [Picea sitchensis]